MKIDPAAVEVREALPTAPLSERPTTIRSLQLLRFVAAFAVVLFHSYIGGRGGEAGMDDLLINRFFALGASGVHIFFVISGFVMVFTSLRGEVPMRPATFIKRRLLRIYPIYWVIALAYLIVHEVIGTAYALSPSEILGAFTLWPELSSKIIGPGWTLSFEMYFYLSFALMLFLPVRYGLPALSALFAACIAMGFVLEPTSPELRLATNGLLLEFLAGCWLAHLYLKGKQLPQAAAIWSIILAILLFAGGVVLGHRGLPSLIVWGLPSIALVAGIIALEQRFSNPIAKFFAKLGDSSYFLYLCHILVIDLVLIVAGDPSDLGIAGLIVFTVLTATFVTIVADIGHRLIELPMLKFLKSRRSGARPTKIEVPAPGQL